MSNNDSLHSMLSSKAAAFFSWLSAAMGIGTFMGFVNTFIGVASACWLTITIWNYFTYTRKKNRLEIEVLRRRLDAADKPIEK